MAAAQRFLATKLDSPGRDITVDVVAPAQENDAVSGWIRLIEFQLVVWNHNLGSDFKMLAAQRLVGPGVGDDGDVLVALDLV